MRPFGPERHLDGIGENVDAAQHLVARVGGKSYVLGSHFRSPQIRSDETDGAYAAFAASAWVLSSTPMTSDSFMMRSSSPSILTSVPDHLPNRMRSPALTSIGTELAGFVASAGADGDDFALLRLLLGGVGNDDAALRLVFAFEATNDDTVVQRTEFHRGFLS